MRLEKDCSDHAVFKQEFFLFNGLHKVAEIPFCCIKQYEYFEPSWNFTYVVSELEKYVCEKKNKKYRKNIRKIRGFGSPFVEICFITFFQL